ncbi:response regulator [Herpetosiphon geysericola]|uniref:Response regulatory domain-containing protein n=1 Tax=Herpetosiphon geysericola TaxID=70996 RepID=A0A0N8GPC3_9CHLR|nr:response regulator [Herpetosiphon geysericola]KPL80498.1 hypothetical protein SE18_23855 [Herpetosiphon geysericola]
MQPTIVLVDDESAIVSILEEFLTDEGYTVVSFSSGAMLMAYLTQQIPQLILTDANLPDMHGGSIGSQLAVNQATSGIPIIVMSGYNAQALDLDDYAGSFLAKPFDLDYLLLLIKQLLHRPTNNAVP